MDIALLVSCTAVAAAAVLRGLAYLLFAEGADSWVPGVSLISAGIAAIVAYVRIDSPAAAAAAILAVGGVVVFWPSAD